MKQGPNHFDDILFSSNEEFTYLITGHTFDGDLHIDYIMDAPTKLLRDSLKRLEFSLLPKPKYPQEGFVFSMALSGGSVSAFYKMEERTIDRLMLLLLNQTLAKTGLEIRLRELQPGLAVLR
jgi:hypothetical protein